jgi:hypothetical protein
MFSARRAIHPSPEKPKINGRTTTYHASIKMDVGVLQVYDNCKGVVSHTSVDEAKEEGQHPSFNL